jgi:hypothetical protein
MSILGAPETIYFRVVEIVFNLVSPRFYGSALSFSKAACKSIKSPLGI